MALVKMVKGAGNNGVIEFHTGVNCTLEWYNWEVFGRGGRVV